MYGLNAMSYIVALRNEKGSYSYLPWYIQIVSIVALRNEKGSYSFYPITSMNPYIVALRNEKGSYSRINPQQY